MILSKGKIESARKLVIYGPEGIGKSTFASRLPGAVFIDTEGSTKHLDVVRTPTPTSWRILLQQINYFASNLDKVGTLVIDTADWAEMLCVEEICSKNQKQGIEDFGYGKGYMYLGEEFGKMLNYLTELVEKGVHVAITAHAQTRKFEQPDESGAYDRWELKLQKKTAPLIKEWADIILFANYKTIIVKNEDKKNKAIGGQRVMYTTHHPCWDAKNRQDLPEELPFEYSAIAHLFEGAPRQANPTGAASIVSPDTRTSAQTANTGPVSPSESEIPFDDYSRAPKALADLMIASNVSIAELMGAIAYKGYFPKDTPVENLPLDFINGSIIPNWNIVLETINAAKEDKPY